MDLIARHEHIVFGAPRMAFQTPPEVLEAARAYLADRDTTEAAWEAYQALYETYRQAMERRVKSESKFLTSVATLPEGRHDWYQVDERKVRRCERWEINAVDVEEIEEKLT